MTSAHSETSLAPPIKPSQFPTESPTVEKIISTLSLQRHPEGGYFVETDRDKLRIPNPFSDAPSADDVEYGPNSATRAASTTIHYLLTPTYPIGYFHRLKARCIHTLHEGRGRYVVMHPSSTPGEPARIESFIVGKNIEAGERLQWIVDGGNWKSSFVIPDEDGGETSKKGVLISETVVPGFEFFDHEFLTKAEFEGLVPEGKTKEELRQLVKSE